MKGVELYAQVRFAVQIEGLSRRVEPAAQRVEPRLAKRDPLRPAEDLDLEDAEAVFADQFAQLPFGRHLLLRHRRHDQSEDAFVQQFRDQELSLAPFRG
jgi:hypothetical protein